MPHGERRDAVVVLAAGRGTRMGSPKALMTVSGRPWWRAQRERIASVGVAELWVVSPDVDAALSREPDAPTRVDGDPDAPMFASVCGGIAVLAKDPPRGVLILPVDVPMCDAATCHALGGVADGPAIPTHNSAHGHPIRLPWSLIASTILPRMADSAWVRATRLDTLVRDACARVPVDDGAVTINLNTPEDVARWESSSRH